MHKVLYICLILFPVITMITGMLLSNKSPKEEKGIYFASGIVVGTLIWFIISCGIFGIGGLIYG